MVVYSYKNIIIIFIINIVIIIIIITVTNVIILDFLSARFVPPEAP